MKFWKRTSENSDPSMSRDTSAYIFSAGSAASSLPATGADGAGRCGPAAFPARTSPPPARAPDSRAHDQDCGGSGCGLFGHADPFGCSLKMSLASELAALTTCSMRWKRKVTPRGRSWWVLVMSVRRTVGTECGLWPAAVANDDNKSPEAHLRMKANMPGGPRSQITSLTVMAKSIWQTPSNDAPGGQTPQAHDVLTPNAERHGRYGTKHGGRNLNDQVAATQWPTPNSMDGERGAESRETKAARNAGGVNLREACNWPTPLDRDHRSTCGPDNPQNSRPSEVAGRLDQDSPNTNGKPTGCLSSIWVETLMGFPPGWTDLT